MGWNSEKHRYECDRCGRPITRNNTLCKKCDIWLQNYVKEVKERIKDGKK